MARVVGDSPVVFRGGRLPWGHGPDTQ